MAETPFSGLGDTALVLRIVIDGSPMNDDYGVQSIHVHHAINKISTAEIILIGEVEIDSGNIAITDSNDLTPGNVVEILAGYVDSGAPISIFKGIIVKHSVMVDTEKHYSFSVECKHEAVKMTYNETERYFEKETDDRVINSIISGYGLSGSVGSCTDVNESMFQKLSTDWDFILARSDFNGFIVTLDGDSIKIDKPSVSGAAVLTIEAGISLNSFEGTLNAEFQPSEVKASAWDAKTLTLINASASEPSVNSQGSITAKELSGKLSQSDLNLTSVTPMTSDALKKWANSILLRKRLNAFTGTVSYFGNALAKTGSIIEIKGVGKKLSGQAFVSGVTHKVDSGNWTTSVAFGLDDSMIHQSQGFSYPPAMGQLPAMQGLQLATVKQIDQDSDNLFRIQLQIPSGSGTPNTTWARMAHHYASNNAGSFFLPEIGDEVVLGFLDNDSRFPVILGSLYNGQKAAPYTPEAKNNTKAFVTRSNMKIEFDEEKKNISLLTPGKNSIIISDDGKSIELKDQNNNSIKLSADGITIDSAKDITISAKGNVNVTAVSKISATAQQDLALAGLNVTATANVGFTAKGNATAEISASGQTTVKGAIVMIN